MTYIYIINCFMPAQEKYFFKAMSTHEKALAFCRENDIPFNCVVELVIDEA